MHRRDFERTRISVTIGISQPGETPKDRSTHTAYKSRPVAQLSYQNTPQNDHQSIGVSLGLGTYLRYVVSSMRGKVVYDVCEYATENRRVRRSHVVILTRNSKAYLIQTPRNDHPAVSKSLRVRHTEVEKELSGILPLNLSYLSVLLDVGIEAMISD